jgi:hypothetical protein
VLNEEKFWNYKNFLPGGKRLVPDLLLFWIHDLLLVNYLQQAAGLPASVFDEQQAGTTG